MVNRDTCKSSHCVEQGWHRSGWQRFFSMGVQDLSLFWHSLVVMTIDSSRW